MALRNYERLDIETFGHHLIRTGDLDPIYIALDGAKLERPQLKRWLLSYWCFYNAGVACYMSEKTGAAYWDLMMDAARNSEAWPPPIGGRWPRGHERRHFRGEASVSSVASYRSLYELPEHMVDYITFENDAVHPVYSALAKRAQEHKLFGPWISFKVGDMAERVMGIKVDFSEAEVFMFDDPRRAALMLWRRSQGLPETAKPKDEAKAISAVVQHLLGKFGDYNAWPRGDRKVGFQEVETVLCKWKSHLNGHYPLGNDTREIREGVEPWARHCATAGYFLRAMPKLVEKLGGV